MCVSQKAAQYCEEPVLEITARKDDVIGVGSLCCTRSSNFLSVQLQRNSVLSKTWKVAFCTGTHKSTFSSNAITVLQVISEIINTARGSTIQLQYSKGELSSQTGI
jgi:hypothetical protein